MDSLSDCLLLHIFKKCGQFKEDIWRARFVCKRWYNLLADSELWQVCNLSKFKLNDVDISKHLMRYIPVTDLQCLEVTSNVLSSEVVNLFLKEASQLNTLRLTKCAIRSNDETEIEYMIPPRLKHIDVRESKGDLTFLQAIITKNGPIIKALGLSNSFGQMTKIENQPFSSLLPNLEMLECYDCLWFNDHAIMDVSNFCRKLVSLNVAECNNVSGTTIRHLLNRCTNLQTLVLRKTCVRNSDMATLEWGKTKITELDLSQCYFLEDECIAKAVRETMHRLEYLRCAFTDHLINRMSLTPITNPCILSIELRRRHQLTNDSVVKLLYSCTSLEALDASVVPIHFDSFKALLPRLTKLKFFSFAGNVGLKTRETIKLLHHHCLDLESLHVNYSNSFFEETFCEILVNYIRASKKIRALCIEGAYAQPVVKELIHAIKDLHQFQRGQLKIFSPNEFEFPQPKLSLTRNILGL